MTDFLKSTMHIVGIVTTIAISFVWLSHGVELTVLDINGEGFACRRINERYSIKTTYYCFGEVDVFDGLLNSVNASNYYGR